MIFLHVQANYSTALVLMTRMSHRTLLRARILIYRDMFHREKHVLSNAVGFITLFADGCLILLLPIKWVVFFFLFLSLIQLYVKIISAHMRRANQWGENGRTPGKTTWHTRKQNLGCLTCGQCGARTHNRHSGEMIE